MAFELSPLRQAVRDMDLEAFKQALATTSPTPAVVMGCAAELLEGGFFGFARHALPLLVEHGLDPNAAPKVAPHGQFSDQLPHSVQQTLRLPPQGSFGLDDVGLPLASRAALVDADLLESLLLLGANPQRGGKQARLGSQAPMMFGSAWASALALSGTEQGEKALAVLARHDPRPWSEDSGMAVDAVKALVSPSHASAPPKWSASDAVKAWEVIESRVPPLTRSQWADVWGRAVGWSLLRLRSPSRRRLPVLVEALPFPALAGLYDASREKGWDLRGLAQAEDIDGNPGPWRAIEKHWKGLGCDDHPQWAEAQISTRLPDGSSQTHTVPLDALGHLLVKTKWSPAPSEESLARADAWLEKLLPNADPCPADRTLGQWWMSSLSPLSGAPVEWVARHPHFWQPHPETGRTPLHECQNLKALARHPKLLSFLDWGAKDDQGNEAGATALASATHSEEGIRHAVKALNDDFLIAAGQCAHRPASAWVAFHPALRQAYDASCARHGIKGVRGTRTPWRLHAAVESMSVSRVRQVLARMTPDQRVKALTQVDPLGRTPLMWWALARPAINRDGSASKTWENRSAQVFDMLTGHHAPMWVPGMESHPFAPFLGKDLDSVRVGRSNGAMMILARDFGRHLSDPDFRQQAWKTLAPGWGYMAASTSIAKVWRQWQLDPEWCKELLMEAWESFCDRASPSGNPLWAAGQVEVVTRKTLELWSMANAPVGPSDLLDPRMISMFERLSRVFPEPAAALREHPVLGTALRAMEIDQSWGASAVDERPTRAPGRPRF